MRLSARPVVADPDLGATRGYADRYDPDTHFDRWYTDATARQLVGYLEPGDRILELGSASGRMTEAMCAVGAVVSGIERSREYVERARNRNLVGASYEVEDFEEWVVNAVRRDSVRFDHVVVTNVVHELRSPEATLRCCARLLEPGGRLHVTLQNPESIHRLTGQALGLIEDLRDITLEGRDLLSLRIYDAEELSGLIVDSGFEIVARHGVMLKPFPNAEMSLLTDEQLEGLIDVGPKFPEHCALNYLVAGRRND